MQEKFCISLSSIPSRFQSVKEVINSLNRQTIKPDNIFLNIPFSYERFPEIKDVNIDTFKDIIDSSTTNGLAAQLKFNYWKKV